MREYLKIDVLLGKTLAAVENKGDEIILRTTDGEVYRQYHSQNCCESVTVEEIVGDLSDLIGSPILQAEEVEGGAEVAPAPEYAESFTWTFYKLATIKGGVTIRWLGQSNGYY